MPEKYLLFFALLFLCMHFVFYSNKSVEPFHSPFNIPTRWPLPLYDLRGYPHNHNNYFFLHKGRLLNNKYLNLSSYSDLYYYLPYYNNGMIFTADGQYTYDQFASLYPNIPIIYYTPQYAIDWYGLINNGLLNIN